MSGSVTEFILIRHGQTRENLAGILQGQRDTPLDELGIMQAECAARRLHKEKIDAVYSSDLGRAMKTAEIIAESHQVQVTPCPALREWNLGELEGRPREEVTAAYPEIMNSFKVECEDAIVPGGETRRELYRRVGECLDELVLRHPNQKLILVSHAGAIRAIFRHIVGKIAGNVMLPQISNGSYSRFCFRENRWQLCTWNDVSHLAEIGFRESTTF